MWRQPWATTPRDWATTKPRGGSSACSTTSITSREGAKILREHGVDEEIISAILSHADWNIEQYPRDTPLRKTLFAVDELCGFIYAAALVRPQRLVGMKAKSIRKKMKQKSFAAAVSRDDIVAGAESLDIPLDEHINECITALSTETDALGLSLPDPV